DSQILPLSEWFEPPRVDSLDHAQPLDLEGLIGRATSSSYVPRDPASLDFLREELGALWREKRDARGFVRLAYRTVVFLAERADGVASREREMPGAPAAW